MKHNRASNTTQYDIDHLGRGRFVVSCDEYGSSSGSFSFCLYFILWLCGNLVWSRRLLGSEQPGYIMLHIQIFYFRCAALKPNWIYSMEKYILDTINFKCVSVSLLGEHGIFSDFFFVLFTLFSLVCNISPRSAENQFSHIHISSI